MDFKKAKSQQLSRAKALVAQRKNAKLLNAACSWRVSSLRHQRLCAGLICPQAA
jgi:hypothetical protein